VLAELEGRGVTLPDGCSGVLEALRMMISMQRAGPIVMHHWIATAREHAVSWGAIARQLGVRRQTAHERYSRPAREVHDLPLRAFSASVQVARDLASQPYTHPGEDPWALAQSGLWDRLPPRDQIDLAALNEVLIAVEEELAWLVAEARCRGMTWGVVGQVLGEVSRQAAHKRFGAPVSKILLPSLPA
jgi:hypothetical protein